MNNYADLEIMFKQLKLSTFVSNYEAFSREAAKEGRPYEDYLKALVMEELGQRTQNTIRRLLANAKFPQVKTLSEFDFTEVPELNKQQVIQLAECNFIDKAQNICFIGTTGAGKSHLATAIGYEACKRKYSTIFIPAAKLVNELIEAKKEMGLSKTQKKYARFDLVIIDELGYIPFSREGAQLLFQFFADSYERQSVVVTTNLEFSKWTQFLGDPVMTAALLDRFTHHCHIFSINKESYRLKKRNKN